MITQKETYKNLTSELLILHIKTTKNVIKYRVWSNDFYALINVTKKTLVQLIKDNDHRTYSIIIFYHDSGNTYFTVEVEK